MPSARCSKCGHEFPYPPSAAGRSGPCPRCRQLTPFGPPAAPPVAARPVPAGLEATSDLPPDASSAVVPPVPAAVRPSPATPPALGPGVLLGGRYELGDELGRGAFGVVYRGRDTRLNGKGVAVKVLLDRALADPEAVKRFRSEAAVLCGINHAHVPAVLDMGEYAGQHYIVSAFVDGRTVREMIPEGGFEDPADAVRIVAKLARTLHDIHAEGGILHRDVKPANMMVPRGQADGLYLMDFGLAVCHDTDGERTREGTTLGTPLYMSPEQASGRISAICHASDIYCAGVVLYHLLTGRTPFVSLWPAIAYEHVHTLPEPPSAYRDGIDAELDAIVLRALSKQPEDRHATGTEFARELELWAARQLVSVSGGGRVYPRRRAYPSSGSVPGSMRRASGDQSSVVNSGGETLNNARTQTGGGTVVVVTPASSASVWKVVVGVVLVLLVLAVGALALTRGKPEPTTPKANPNKEWVR